MKKKSKEYTLYGGKKPATVRETARRHISGGSEGHTYLVHLDFLGRKVTLVEKKFKPPVSLNLSPAYRRPSTQFKIMNTLLERNRKEKRGLRIVPTIRKRVENGKTTLFTTYLEEFDHKLYNHPDFRKDYLRQDEILWKMGYRSHFDAFAPINQGGKVIAVIHDFGNIHPIEH